MEKDISPEIQTLFLEIAVQDPQSFVRIQNIYNPENFDRSLRSTAAFIEEHARKYNTMPDPKQIEAVTGIKLRPIPDLNSGHIEWFMDAFEQFTRRRELERAILKAADLIEKGEYDPVEHLIKEAVQISLTKNMGIDYFDDPRSRLLALKESNGQVSTGWPSLDQKLYGGFNRGELNLFAGGCVTGDTKVQIIELPEVAGLSDDAVDELYQKAQPKIVDIKSLENKPVSEYLINSPDGYVRAKQWRNKGSKQCSRLTTKNRKIVASNDHFFQMENGKWKYLEYITPGERVLTVDGVEEVLSVQSCGIRTVYDFEIDSREHRYYTNGISSHNSGSGKSLFMQNMAVNWGLMGLNGVYLSLELSEGLSALRIDSMMTDIPTKEIFKNLDDVELKLGMIRKKSGTIRIKYMPAQSTVNDIRAYIRELQIQTGETIDFLMVDYLDLVTPVSVKVNPNDTFIKDKYVAEELRNLAQELQILLVTASQLNRCLALDTKVIANGKEIEIKDVEVGDWLESNEGPVQVYEKLPVTTQSVYRIKTKSGKEIICSAKHKFPTPDGLKTIESGLKKGDYLRSVLDKDITDSEPETWSHRKMSNIFEIDDEIVEIEYIGEQDTIDINTTGNRLFYANGILTHNSAVEEVEFDHSMIAGGISKINTADNVIGIFTSRAMRERGRYQIQLMKTRSSSGVGQKVDLGFDINTLRIVNIDEEDDSYGNGPPSSSIMEKIKSKTELVDNSASEVKKVPKAEVQGSKLKAMLANLNLDND